MPSPLNAGGRRRRRVTALVVKTQTGSQGRGASLGVVGDNDGWGPDDRVADAPFRRVSEGGGSSSRPLSIVLDQWTAMTWTVRIRSGQVI